MASEIKAFLFEVRVLLKDRGSRVDNRVIGLTIFASVSEEKVNWKMIGSFSINSIGTLARNNEKREGESSIVAKKYFDPD